MLPLVVYLQLWRRFHLHLAGFGFAGITLHLCTGAWNYLTSIHLFISIDDTRSESHRRASFIPRFIPKRWRELSDNTAVKVTGDSAGQRRVRISSALPRSSPDQGVKAPHFRKPSWFHQREWFLQPKYNEIRSEGSTLLPGPAKQSNHYGLEGEGQSS